MHPLKKLRHEFRMTQQQLAKKLNLNLATVSRWENELTPIRDKYIPELADIFGERVYSLFDFDDAGKSVTQILPIEYIRLLKDYRLTGIVEYLLECDSDLIEVFYERIAETGNL